VVKKRATLTILSARLVAVRFIPEHGGLFLIEPPGTGNSHIALGLTLASTQAGHTALHRSAFDLARTWPKPRLAALAGS
jgi:hypothetical protein